MRSTMKILASVIAVVVLVPAPEAVAQRRRGLVDISRPHDRHGAWLHFGLGRGSESFRFSNDPAGYSDDLAKPSLWLAAGGTVNPHLRLGGEINAWINEFNDNGEHFTQSLVGGLLTAQVFPVRDLGLFAKGGVGISRSGEDISGGTGTGETGFAYLYGAGYEIKLGRNFFLTPVVSLMKHTSTSGGPDPDNLGTLHERVWTFGVGLTFQPGR